MLGFGATGQFAIGEVSTPAETATLDKWFVPLATPVRFLPGLRPSLQQFGALADPFPFVSFSWQQELSIPSKRTLPGLRPGQQQFIAFHPAPSPFVATGWFEPLNEPVRSLPGLPRALMPFVAAPVQLRPTPTTTGVLAALETKDVFLGGAAIFNPPTSAEIGIVDTTRFAAEIGLVQTGAAGTIASVQISISIV